MPMPNDDVSVLFCSIISVSSQISVTTYTLHLYNCYTYLKFLDYCIYSYFYHVIYDKLICVKLKNVDILYILGLDSIFLYSYMVLDIILRNRYLELN